MRRRRAITIFVIGSIILTLLAGAIPPLVEESLPAAGESGSQAQQSETEGTISVPGSAAAALDELAVKGRAPKTGYTRDQFGGGWATVQGCSTRNIILHRDMENAQVDEKCTVVSGNLNDPYTGELIQFTKEKSSDVQIDHVIALSDAWQKGAQQLSKEERKKFANDPLELLAASGPENQAKGDGDAATWLPKNKAFRCEYVARQIAVKIKYTLWVTQAEKDAMRSVLKTCPEQALP